jgi:hypothetical protein
MNETYKIKYLKYKNKYLELKKQLGGASINHLDETMNTEIAKINDCKDIINKLSVNKQLDINFDQLPRPINTTLDLRKPNRSICSHITDLPDRDNSDKRDKCNQYYNECYNARHFKNLYRRYFPNSPEPVNYDVDTLNKIFLSSLVDYEPFTYIDRPFINKNDVQNFLSNLGSNLTDIPDNAFRSRLYLGHVEIPNTVKTIGNNAFMRSGLTSLELPVNLKYIGNGAFANNNLTEVVIPNTVIYIGERSFVGNNNLIHVTIPHQFGDRVIEIFGDIHNITFHYI